ncbi:heavy-metal-associated domain-containing protein [Actinotalea sp.]|uniref:heavy-metal-associated domain-containing protein n=1 Tax=Actinotalea sp. TaxID=1872145 RepID=UPI0035642F68
MPDTPRLVVGSATFHVLGMGTPVCARAVLLEVHAVAGVASARADVATCTLTVIAASPLDRAEIVAAARRAGHDVAP